VRRDYGHLEYQVYKSVIQEFQIIFFRQKERASLKAASTVANGATLHKEIKESKRKEYLSVLPPGHTNNG